MKDNIVPIEDEIVLYQSEDGNVKVDVLFQDETVWLTQEQMAMLFGKARSTINEHIQNIYQEGELQESNSMRKFGNSEFSMKPTNYYNLDVIISVGYRVKSRQGTMFRIWATQRLRDYIIRGYALNEERFKKGSSMNYLKHQGYDSDRDRNQIANFTYLDYNTNIDIADNPPADYVGRYREKLGEDGYRLACEQNALPIGFESMDYFTFWKREGS
jgi:hypothetical protein